MSRPTTAPALACVALTAGLLTGGCGSVADPGPAVSPTSASPSGRPSTTSDADYPITIVRSGGLAGFADRVVIAEGGTAQVTTKSGTSTCTVTAQVLAALTRTAASATGSPSATSPNPDAMAVTVTTPRGSTALDDGNLPGTAPEVATLLEDLTKPVGERTACL